MAARNDFKAKTRDSWPDGDMAESEVYEAHKKMRQAESGLSYGCHHPAVATALSRSAVCVSETP